MIFVNFLEMVEERFGLATADRVIEQSDSMTGGAYTSVGTYDHREMVRMVTALAGETGIPAADLVRAYGRHLFGYFVHNYPDMFASLDSTFGFLENLDGYIHVEVRKLYADAELPRFEMHRPERADTRVMTYQSSRAFADLAEGLMHGCADHFNEHITIHREDLSGGDGTTVRFTLVMAAGPTEG